MSVRLVSAIEAPDLGVGTVRIEGLNGDGVNEVLYVRQATCVEPA